MDAINTGTPTRVGGDRYFGPVHPAPTSLGGLLARADARQVADAERSAARRAADEALAASVAPTTGPEATPTAESTADIVLDLRTSPPVVHHPDPPMVEALHDLVAEAALETWWSLEIAAEDTRRRGGDIDPLASLGWSLRDDE